ncbi:alpha-2-macroglobulin family protein [Hymenobacter latericus]|uniref:alpha-2-macroglobulin family protein n=1 Tax=Hymenobacter sp. YIM 151858-1 TaxID=2987688 RepID=UPI0022273093|nr:alpha-2-macroglobulin family protein [Hymenobacter sp. YIM 151858-1]UYZ59086.1 MG2 domain-containing protein [Hymenobacter sp. YIM 151858-1]
MRFFLLILAAWLLLMVVPSNASAPPAGGPYAAHWKKIDVLLQKDQTEAAQKLVLGIYEKARAARHTADYVRALVYRLHLLRQREEDADAQSIRLLEADLGTAAFPARPIVHSLLAEQYHQYLRQNRYRLYERTQLAAADSLGAADLATWDAARLAAQVVRHYRASAETEAARLQQTTLRDLGPLATPADAPGQQLRPTLYDLLAHRAIEALRDDELYLTRPAEQFRFTDARLLAPAEAFAQLPLGAPAADSLNGPLHALRLWQQLTAFRLRDAQNPAALADAERLRLAFVHEKAAFANKTAAYTAALRRAQHRYDALPAWADFQAELAEQAQRQKRLPEALELARAAVRRYPKSVGAARAQGIINELERPELQVRTAEVALPNQAMLLSVRYRNLRQVYGFAWKLPAAALLREQLGQRDAEIPKAYARRLGAKPAATWTMALPGPADYRAHRAEVAGPKLPAGHYLVLLSTANERPAQERENVATAYAFVSVSELGEVHRAAPASGTDLWTLDRRTGQPLAGVGVQLWYQEYTNGKERHRAGPVLQSSAEGFLNVPPDNERRAYQQALLLRRGADSLVVQTNLGNNRAFPNRNPAQEQRPQAFLYTDRAIYRPGQTLYFKGIVAQKQNGRSQVLQNTQVQVRLLDVNGQPVQEFSFTTSDYGSFHGSAVLPTGLLNGQMQLQVRSKFFSEAQDLGQAFISVEDYKRPTFFVALDPVKGTPKLGDTLSVRGTATAYAGPAVDGATVQYRVVRRTVWPMFAWAELDFGFGGPGIERPYFPNRGGEQQIATGTVTTDAQGRFRVSFTATPPDDAANDDTPDDEDQDDYRPPGPWRPSYVFEVTADVTDPNGETRSAERGVTLGGQPLNLALSGPRQVNQQQIGDAFVLRSQNATGEAVPATGTLRLYRLTPPARVLRPRLWQRPDQPGLSREQHQQLFPLDAWLSEDDPDKWPRTAVGEWRFDTGQRTGLPEVAKALGPQTPGAYLLEANTTTGSDTARTRLGFTLYNPTAQQLPLPVPQWLTALRDTVAPGQAAQVLIGSGFEAVQARLEVESQGQLVRAEWLTLRREQRLIALPTTAANAGPMHVRLMFVHAGRFYQQEATVQVAEPERPLQLAISTFRDKLQPGQKETWRVTIRNSQNQPAAAELLASLYDQSLDYFRPHAFAKPVLPQPYFGQRFAWSGAGFWADNWPLLIARFAGEATGRQQYLYPDLRTTLWQWQRVGKPGEILRPRSMADRQLSEVVVTGYGGGRNVRIRGASTMQAAPMAASAQSSDAMVMVEEVVEHKAKGAVSEVKRTPRDLSTVPVRSDFRETALWAPAVRTNDKGEVVLEFQMPEAVTRWQLLTLAHTPDLQTGMLARQLVTQKQLMVTPNAPRFFREGDQLRLTAKISNLTGKALGGTAQLLLLDARTNQPIDKQLLRGKAQEKFKVAANQSTTVGWELSIPAGLEAVTYRVVAQAKNYSDGEENTLPVLPNRLLVTEALPLTVRGNSVRAFELRKLTSTTSATRQNQSLTLELTSNPAWYAVQSLPYLMEYPYECSEQVFSRLYANTLAARIVQQNPRIRPVLEEWKRAAASGDKNALRSKLEQNQELKALLLQETPWVREGQSDTERMRRLAELFDEARLQAETQRAAQKLQELQSPSGAFPWFKQMPDNRYITQVVVAGFGRLRRLGAFDAQQDAQTADVLLRAVAYLDRQLAADYAQLRRQKGLKLTDDHLGDATLHALYARSFWATELPVPAEAKPAYDYYREQTAKYWPKRNRYLQGFAAVVLHRNGQAKPAREVLEALRQNALRSDELGMYWKDVQPGFYWQQAPTETQAQLIEAFSEVAPADQQSVEEMKLWLLAHKRTHNWESTRATADACYALLLQGGRNWLEPAQPLQVSLGAQAINTSQGAEAGTGYLKRSYPAAEVKPTMGKVRVHKTDAGVAWGALYWQYFEQLDKITQADKAPITLTRQLFRENPSNNGPVLTPLQAAAPLRVGEVLVVRLVLKTDRELEFVHLKDTRAAGLELISQTSGYRYQQGLGYYESPRDAATNFFMDVLPRGTHVFEYRLRAAQAGDFSSGISQVQCLYAPEFTSHSAGQRLRIGPQ